MIRRLPELRKELAHNAPNKIVALFATIVLWLTILGRKDTVLSRDINVEFILSPNHVVANEDVHKVRVKASGPRMSLKKFNQSQESIVIDLNQNGAGVYTVRIPREGVLDLPIGTKILSVQPNVIRVRIVKQNEQK